MNRAGRRSVRRARQQRYADVPLFNDVTSCICDGYPCPYCSEITAPGDDGIWRCTCGWSAVLVTTKP